MLGSPHDRLPRLAEGFREGVKVVLGKCPKSELHSWIGSDYIMDRRNDEFNGCHHPYRLSGYDLPRWAQLAMTHSGRQKPSEWVEAGSRKAPPEGAVPLLAVRLC